MRASDFLDGSPAAVASAGARFFGFVIGGAFDPIEDICETARATVANET